MSIARVEAALKAGQSCRDDTLGRYDYKSLPPGYVRVMKISWRGRLGGRKKWGSVEIELRVRILDSTRVVSAL